MSKRYWLPVAALVAAPVVLAHGGGPSGGADSASAPTYANLAASGSASWSKVVSVAQPLRTNSPLFPGDPVFTSELWTTVETDGYKLENIALGTHTGTHMSAPCHFIDGALCVDDLPAKMFVRKAVVIDVRARVAVEGGDFQVTKQDIRDWERQNGRIPEGAMVLLETGFSADFFNDHYFDDAPGFSGEAVAWLMRSTGQGGRGAAGTGSDTFGPDATSDVNFDASYETYLAGGVTLENLAHLERLPAQGATIVFLPALLKDGSGFQTNVIGLVP